MVVRPHRNGLIALLTVVCLLAGCTSSDDTPAAETTTTEATAAQTTTEAPAATVAAPATATTAAPTTTTTAPEPQIAELLAVGDLPTHIDWIERFDVGSGDGNILGWSANSHGVLAIRCPPEELPGLFDFVSMWDFDADPPLRDPEGVLFKTLYAESETGSIAFGEVLYADSPSAVTAAFNATKDETGRCVDDQDRWSAWEVSRLAMPQVEEDHVAAKWKGPPWTPAGKKYDVFRLAIVRLGSRLLIVEEHEGPSLLAHPLRVTDAEFAATVDVAVNRIASD